MQHTLGIICLYAGLICWLAACFAFFLMVPGFVAGLIQGAIGGPFVFFWFGRHGHGRATPAQAVKAVVALLVISAIIVFLISSSI